STKISYSLLPNITVLIHLCNEPTVFRFFGSLPPIGATGILSGNRPAPVAPRSAIFLVKHAVAGIVTPPHHHMLLPVPKRSYQKGKGRDRENGLHCRGSGCKPGPLLPCVAE